LFKLESQCGSYEFVENVVKEAVEKLTNNICANNNNGAPIIIA